MMRWALLLAVLIFGGCVQPPENLRPPKPDDNHHSVVINTDFGIAQIAYDSMPSSKQSDEPEIIAKAFTAAADYGRKSSYALIDDMKSTAAKQIADSLSDDRRHVWADWQQKVGEKINELEKSGKIEGRLGWISACDEVAMGLRGGK